MYQAISVALKVLVVTIVFLVLNDVYQELYYLYKSRKHGCGIVPTERSWPLGIMSFVELSQAFRQRHLIQYLMNSLPRHDGRLTTRRQILFNFNMFTHDPVNIKAMLGGNQQDYAIGLRRNQFFPILHNSIFTNSGEPWKHSRTLLRPMFSKDQLSRLQIMESHTSELISIIKNTCINEESKIDIQDLFFKLTMDNISHVLFGQSVYSLSAEERYLDTKQGPRLNSDISRAINGLLEYLNSRTRLSKLYWMYSEYIVKKDRDLVFDFVDELVEKALREQLKLNEKPPEDSCIVLTQLIEHTHDPMALRCEMLSLLVAGRDTTASMLTYLIYELAKHQDEFEKLRSAVLETFGNGPEGITFEALKRCVPLQNVLNEVLRLHPIVPVNFRESLRDTTLPRGGGPGRDEPIFVPKGTMMLFTVHVMHHNKDIWGPDADEFLPDRWSRQEERKARDPWAYLPFNGGPRICLGQQFALTEAGYVTVRLLQSFSKLSVSKEYLAKPLDEVMTITVKIYGGLEVNFSV